MEEILNRFSIRTRMGNFKALYPYGFRSLIDASLCFERPFYPCLPSVEHRKKSGFFVHQALFADLFLPDFERFHKYLKSLLKIITFKNNKQIMWVACQCKPSLLSVTYNCMQNENAVYELKNIKVLWVALSPVVENIPSSDQKNLKH